MHAVISGRAGRALVLDGKSLTSFDVDDASNRVPRRPSDLPYLFGESQDLRVIENSDIESIGRELKAEADLNLALDLTLISLDEELEEDIRKDALQDLNEILADNHLVEGLENILYARPLPEDGDLVGALKFCTDARLRNALSLLQRFEEHQAVIAEVSSAWDVIPTKAFGSYELQAHFQRVGVREGLFRALVTALAEPDPTRGANLPADVQGKLSRFYLDAGLNPSIKNLRNHRQVLQDWTSSFRLRGGAVTIKHEIEEEERETAPRRRHGRFVGIDRPAVLREVNRQKAIISAGILRREFENVRELTEDLVDYQLKSGETKHLAKSLCDLAMEAKELGMFSLQLELTERSIGIAPDDGWSWAQHADALLNMQRLDDALHAYEQADAFGAGVVAKAGRAEVLKAQGQFDAALTAFDEVIMQHPEDVVAKNGRAEALKAQGQLDAALTAFDEVIREHPENVVAKSGRARVLKAQGQLDAALTAFDEVIRDHPEDVVAKSGRAEVLKAQGQLDAALTAFDEVIREHPENVVAKSGRAEVLKAQGQFDAALTAFDEVIRERPENVFAKTGRAEVLRAMGLFDEALLAYNEIIAEFPEDIVAKNGRDELLNAKAELYDSLMVHNEMMAKHPEDLTAEVGRDAVLAAIGQLNNALVTYNGLSSVLAAKGRYHEALRCLPRKSPINLQDWNGYYIRGLILLFIGQVTEAVRIFNEGLQKDSSPGNQEHFRSALVIERLKDHDFEKASQILDETISPSLQSPANILRIHAFGALGDTKSAAQAHMSLAPSTVSKELVEELHRRYVLHRKPLRTDEWIVEQELMLLLASS